MHSYRLLTHIRISDPKVKEKFTKVVFSKQNIIIISISLTIINSL